MSLVYCNILAKYNELSTAVGSPRHIFIIRIIFCITQPIDVCVWKEQEQRSCVSSVGREKRYSSST